MSWEVWNYYNRDGEKADYIRCKFKIACARGSKFSINETTQNYFKFFKNNRWIIKTHNKTETKNRLILNLNRKFYKGEPELGTAL